MGVKADVQRAIDQVKAQFPKGLIEVREDGQGGAYLKVDPVDLGQVYTENTRMSWLGFHISFQYPFADVYPHHVRRDLTRADGKPLSAGMGYTRYEGFGIDSVQLSRRSNHREASLETAAHKAMKVIEWARTL
jgi:hypothetical protein